MHQVQSEIDNQGEGVMCEEENAFIDVALSIVKDHIRSVILIDDEFSLATENDKTDVSTNKTLFSKLYDTFISKEVLFCGIRYTDSKKDTAIALAQKADFLILDWDLASDVGATSLDILKKLLDTGLKFICIYTGQVRPSDLTALILQHLNGDIKPESTDNGFIYKNLVVFIANKPGIPLDNTDIIDGEDVYERAVRIFTNKFKGFVQLSLMDMTNRHRECMPKLLEKIEPNLDIGVLIEAADEGSPVDIEGARLRQILLDEWHVELDNYLHKSESVIFSEAGLPLFTSSLTGNIPENWPESVSICLKCVNPNKIHSNIDEKIRKLQASTWQSNLNEWLLSGLNKDVIPKAGEESWGQKINYIQTCMLYPLFEKKKIMSGELNPLSPLLTLDSFFHQTEIGQKLTQGSILKSPIDSEYLICITPLCDTANPQKISHIYKFLIARECSVNNLEKSNEPYVVISIGKDNESIPILVGLKRTIIITIEDRNINEDNNINGDLSQSELKTDQKPYKKDFPVVAQLRKDVALNLAQRAAADASRVGLDRVETIRKRLE